jgi:hypothetical protein
MLRNLTFIKNRLKLLWTFVKLSSRARELELEWQKAQQERDNYAFSGDKEKFLYQQGFCEGILHCMKRFSVLLLLLIPTLASSDAGFNPPSVTVSEADGSPRRKGVQELEFSAGTVTISGNKASISNTGGAGGMSPGATYYVQVRDTLQTGATFYVSSGTIAQSLRIGNEAATMAVFLSSGLPHFPGGGTDSQRIGSGALSLRASGIAFGVGAVAIGPSDTVIGQAATTANTSGGNTVLGTNSTVTGFNNVCIGASSACTSNGAIGIGLGTSAASGAVAVGNGITAAAATTVVGGSASAGTNGTALGNGAATTSSQGTAIGASASATFEAVAIGYSAITNGAGAANNSVAIGARSNVTGTAGIALGQSAVASTNEFVVGNVGAPINNVYINEGKTSTSPSMVTIQGSGGSGSNVDGSSVTIAGGKGTGTGLPGDIIFRTSTIGVSGSTLQALAERARINSSGLAVSASHFFQFGSLSKASILALTPSVVGQSYYCSDCTASTVCISTGTTVASFSDINSRIAQCN